MRRSATWLLLGFALALATIVMAGITYATLDLEEKRKLDAADAYVEEQTRLALWRMDSMLGPMIALENSRPHQFFTKKKCGNTT